MSCCSHTVNTCNCHFAICTLHKRDRRKTRNNPHCCSHSQQCNFGVHNVCNVHVYCKHTHTHTHTHLRSVFMIWQYMNKCSCPTLNRCQSWNINCSSRHHSVPVPPLYIFYPGEKDSFCSWSAGGPLWQLGFYYLCLQLRAKLQLCATSYVTTEVDVLQ